MGRHSVDGGVGGGRGLLQGVDSWRNLLRTVVSGGVVGGGVGGSGAVGPGVAAEAKEGKEEGEVGLNGIRKG